MKYEPMHYTYKYYVSHRQKWQTLHLYTSTHNMSLLRTTCVCFLCKRETLYYPEPRCHPAANICIQLEIPATFLKHEIAGPHKYPEIFNKSCNHDHVKNSNSEPIYYIIYRCSVNMIQCIY